MTLLGWLREPGRRVRVPAFKIEDGSRREALGEEQGVGGALEGIEEGGGAVEVEGPGGKAPGDAANVAEDGLVAVQRAETDGWGAHGPVLTAGALALVAVGSAKRLACEGHGAAYGAFGGSCGA